MQKPFDQIPSTIGKSLQGHFELKPHCQRHQLSQVTLSAGLPQNPIGKALKNAGGQLAMMSPVVPWKGFLYVDFDERDPSP